MRGAATTIAEHDVHGRDRSVNYAMEQSHRRVAGSGVGRAREVDAGQALVRQAALARPTPVHAVQRDDHTARQRLVSDVEQARRQRRQLLGRHNPRHAARPTLQQPAAAEQELPFVVGSGDRDQRACGVQRADAQTISARRLRQAYQREAHRPGPHALVRLAGDGRPARQQHPRSAHLDARRSSRHGRPEVRPVGGVETARHHDALVRLGTLRLEAVEADTQLLVLVAREQRCLAGTRDLDGPRSASGLRQDRATRTDHDGDGHASRPGAHQRDGAP
jgi:hypothetical protein